MAIQSSEAPRSTLGSKLQVSRPLLPTTLTNPHIQTFESSRPPSVKFQIITREGQDIVVGRIKVPTPNSQHAFILRRFDTGAVSLTTMFRASFPGATDEQERLETQWVKNALEKSAVNGAPQPPSAQLRLAGTWVSEQTALKIAPDYGLQVVVDALVGATPDPGISYRKSTKSAPQSPEATVVAPRPEPPSSPNAPNKRRKELSPVPTPVQPTRSSARLKSPGAQSSARSTPARKGRVSKAARATQEVQMQSIGVAMSDDDDAPEVPSVDPEQDIAEAKALVKELKAQRDQERAQSNLEALNSLSEAFSLKRTSQDQREGEAEPFVRPMNLDGDDGTVAIRPVAGNRRINLNLNAEQKALAWGTLAFAFGIGLTSYILPMFA